MSPFPTVFVSHGSPMTAVTPSPAQDFLRGLGMALPRPRAIVAVSAHWDTPVAAVTQASAPKTIHDFYGFPDELYAMEYPAPGAPDLARHTAELIARAGLPVASSASRGLDHGAWLPLLLGWPDADIPVIQLSIQTALGTRHHHQLGQALRPLRDDGVLILGSGALTHNLRAYFHNDPDHIRHSVAFADWMADAVRHGDTDAVLDYRAQAPYAAEAHPHDDHLMPLFVAWGAAQGQGGTILHRSQDRSLAMDAYAFTE